MADMQRAVVGEKRRSLWSGGGWVDTTGAWLVGAKGE